MTKHYQKRLKKWGKVEEKSGGGEKWGKQRFVTKAKKIVALSITNIKLAASVIKMSGYENTASACPAFTFAAKLFGEIPN
ncbi:hypothetical protein I5M27_04345 [Adhaeribacter sp. BT258]|uniref:Uncharacterized protein n=1 Tax=Adhaeribacter terrigena TaxID=2793070 RepID=A0ABS1C0Z8_9BACT|nr:hypothetical protein [Adhaeribacter terrigena]MBK0402200.1 hypothetical protein [Adhaeribacter terrigena]